MINDEFFAKYELRKIIFGNKKFEYITKGNGDKTFIIFPGGGQSAYHTYDLIDTLSESYKVIAINIYNFDSIDEFFQVIHKVLKKEHASELVVYGLSIGGQLALSFTKRNKARVSKLILSHTTLPSSSVYYKKVIKPLKLVSFFLPVIPNWLIKFIANKQAGNLQGVNSQTHENLVKDFDEDTKYRNRLIGKYYFKHFFNKKLLRTWIRLHKDYFMNEHFNQSDFKDWKGKVLIIKTDNDPLVQDEGKLKPLFRIVEEEIFKHTGHLTFFYKSKEITKLIKNFVS